MLPDSISVSSSKIDLSEETQQLYATASDRFLRRRETVCFGGAIIMLKHGLHPEVIRE
jgi:hypothetical protein